MVETLMVFISKTVKDADFLAQVVVHMLLLIIEPRPQLIPRKHQVMMVSSYNSSRPLPFFILV